MPTYEYSCPSGHNFEIFCSISSKPEAPPCPEVLCYEQLEPTDIAQPVEPRVCGLPAKQVFLTPPDLWITGDCGNRKTVLDTPGSKANKAGYVHTHGNIGVQKVSVGAGGALNPRTHREHPLAERVRPDYKTTTKRRLRAEGKLPAK